MHKFLIILFLFFGGCSVSLEPVALDIEEVIAAHKDIIAYTAQGEFVLEQTLLYGGVFFEDGTTVLRISYSYAADRLSDMLYGNMFLNLDELGTAEAQIRKQGEDYYSFFEGVEDQDSSLGGFFLELELLLFILDLAESNSFVYSPDTYVIHTVLSEEDFSAFIEVYEEYYEWMYEAAVFLIDQEIMLTTYIDAEQLFIQRAELSITIEVDTVDYVLESRLQVNARYEGFDTLLAVSLPDTFI